VCKLYICFTYCFFFFVCVFVSPFLPSVKVKHQYFNRQTYQLSEAVSCNQPANSTFGDSLCWILAYNLHTAGCPYHHPSQWIVSRFNHVYLRCSEYVTSCPYHFNLQYFVLLPSSSTPWKLHILSFLSAFAKFKKANISFVMFVCPSVRPSIRLPAWNNSAPIWRIFKKFDIWVFFENLLGTFKFH